MIETAEKRETYYGLPETIVFCNRCVMSNQRPASTPEFRNDAINQRKVGLHIDEQGVCDACRFAELKDEIDWEAREGELVDLLDRYRRSDGYYEVLVPGSGGKDSAYAAHVLKYKYGMKVLTCTWPPHIYTDIGWKNFRNWIDVGGFDNVSFNPNGAVHRLLTKLAFQNLLHPFQPFILGQKNLAPKIALKYDIPLIFYGENEAEYGNPIGDNHTSLRDKSFYTYSNPSDIFISGVPLTDLFENHGLTWNDIDSYIPPALDQHKEANLEVRYLGYYLKWTPQDCYYYSVENTGFEANPFRTEGTYSKYNSLDDRIDGLHYFTTYIKFGLGRTTYEASQEIRNRHLTRDEAVALVQRFDGEFPKKYFSEILEYMDLDEDSFWGLVDNARPPHLWEKVRRDWRLRHSVYE